MRPQKRSNSQPGTGQNAQPGAGYAARSPMQVKADKKRQRELDWRDTRRPAWVAWLSGVCVFVMLLGVLALASNGRTSAPQAVNGDQLGPYGEAIMDYDATSEQKIQAMTGDEPRWALVSPNPDALWSSADVIGVLSGFDARVSTLFAGPGARRELPEPAVGHTRADVINQATASLALQGQMRPEDVRFDGLLVYARPDQLRALDQRVFAVEPAPVDSAYGHFGIRTVTVL